MSFASSGSKLTFPQVNIEPLINYLCAFQSALCKSMFKIGMHNVRILSTLITLCTELFSQH